MSIRARRRGRRPPSSAEKPPRPIHLVLVLVLVLIFLLLLVLFLVLVRLPLKSRRAREGEGLRSAQRIRGGAKGSAAAWGPIRTETLANSQTCPTKSPSQGISPVARPRLPGNTPRRGTAQRQRSDAAASPRAAQVFLLVLVLVNLLIFVLIHLLLLVLAGAHGKRTSTRMSTSRSRNRSMRTSTKRRSIPRAGKPRRRSAFGSATRLSSSKSLPRRGVRSAPRLLRIVRPVQRNPQARESAHSLNRSCRKHPTPWQRSGSGATPASPQSTGSAPSQLNGPPRHSRMVAKADAGRARVRLPSVT